MRIQTFPVSAALALSLNFSLTGCALFGHKKIEEPKLKLENVRMVSAGLEGAQLVFDVKVDNPNPFPLELDKVDYNLEFQDRPVGTGQVDKDLRVEKNASAILHLPVQVQLKNLFNSAAALLGKGTTPYHLKGKAKLGMLSIPFEERGDLRFENGKVERHKIKD